MLSYLLANGRVPCAVIFAILATEGKGWSAIGLSLIGCYLIFYYLPETLFGQLQFICEFVGVDVIEFGVLDNFVDAVNVLSFGFSGLLAKVILVLL
jgi:hypothetical protein